VCLGWYILYLFVDEGGGGGVGGITFGGPLLSGFNGRAKNERDI